MFTYKELIKFLQKFGALPVMAVDISGIQPTKHIKGDDVQSIIATLQDLKDGPHRNWKYSIIIG